MAHLSGEKADMVGVTVAGGPGKNALSRYMAENVSSTTAAYIFQEN
jgi:hypothetical protein